MRQVRSESMPPQSMAMAPPARVDRTEMSRGVLELPVGMVGRRQSGSGETEVKETAWCEGMARRKGWPCPRVFDFLVGEC